MMRASVLTVILLLASGWAGCLGTGDPAETPSADADPDLEPPARTQLFEDPTSRVHPDHDLPTYTTLPEDPDGELPDFWQPIEANDFSLDEIAVEHLAEDPNETIEYGSGIAVWGEIVIVPGRGTGNAWIVDIEDPANPEIVSEFKAGGRDVAPLGFPDGRLYAAFATDGGTVPVWNLTNPEFPVKVAELEPDRGSHNVGFAPGTPYLYNSAGARGGDTGNVPGEGTEGTAIYDLSDPENPELTLDFENGYSCHDIEFGIWPSEDKARAYCAGYQVTQIWDIQDATAPEVIVNIPVHHGRPEAPSTARAPTRFSHLAYPSQDGNVLIVGDETEGGSQPACDVHTSQGPVTATGPVGNLYFYDIRDEQDPVLQGMISADAPALMTDQVLEDTDRATDACTAHFGHTIPSEERDLFAVAFYARGVNVVDFTDPSNPVIVEQWNDGTVTWDVWFYNGYLITGDPARGLDVLELAG